MASAKLANSTVNQSHSVICKLNLESVSPRNKRAVVTTLPISTTNITGFAIIFFGFSFNSESQMARLTIFHSQTAFDSFDIVKAQESIQHSAFGTQQIHDFRCFHQRRNAITDHTASTRPKGHAPWRNP